MSPIGAGDRVRTKTGELECRILDKSTDRQIVVDLGNGQEISLPGESTAILEWKGRDQADALLKEGRDFIARGTDLFNSGALDDIVPALEAFARGRTALLQISRHAEQPYRDSRSAMSDCDGGIRRTLFSVSQEPSAFFTGPYAPGNALVFARVADEINKNPLKSHTDLIAMVQASEDYQAALTQSSRPGASLRAPRPVSTAVSPADEARRQDAPQENSPTTRTAEVKAGPEELLLRLQSAVAKEDYLAGEEIYKTFIESYYSDSLSSDSANILAEFLFRKGARLAQLGDFFSASEIFERIVDQYSETEWADRADDLLDRTESEWATKAREFSRKRPSREESQAQVLSDNSLEGQRFREALGALRAQKAPRTPDTPSTEASGLTKPWRAAIWLTLPVGIVVTLVFGRRLARKVPSVIRDYRRGRAQLKDALLASEMVATNPINAREIADRIVEAYTYDSAASELGRQGRRALGLSLRIVALCNTLDGRPADAATALKRAQTYDAAGADDPFQRLARTLFASRKSDMRAIRVYIGYLSSPADGTTDAAFVASLCDFLATALKIDEATPVAQVDSLAGLNSEVATIPWKVPSVLVALDSGEKDIWPVEGRLQFADLGPHGTRPIRSSGSSMDAALLFSINSESSGYGVELAQPNASVLLNELPVTGKSPIQEGDCIKANRTTLTFFGQARPVSIHLAWPHLYLGVAAYRKNNFTAAERHFRMAERIGYRGGDLPRYQGRILIFRGDYKGAIAKFSKALEADPSSAAAYADRAKSHLAMHKLMVGSGPDATTGHLKDAIEDLRKAQSLDPKNPDFIRDLASAYSRAGNTDAASALLGQVLDTPGQRPEALGKLAAEFQRMGDLDRARIASERALAMDPYEPRSNACLGQLYFEMGDHHKASEHLRRAVSPAQQSGKVVVKPTLQLQFRLGRSLFEIGQYRQASDFLSPLAQQSRDAMFYFARCYSCIGQFESATKVFRKLEDKFGSDPESRYFYAAALANSGDYDRALLRAETLEGDADWKCRAKCLGARILLKLGRLDEAAAKLDEAMTLRPDDRDIQFERARMACLRSDYDAARQLLQDLLRRFPSDLRINFWLGQLSLATGDTRKAQIHLEYVTESPDRKTGHENRACAGHAFFCLGRIAVDSDAPGQAIEYFEQARDYGIQGDELAYELASSYQKSGRFADALAEFSALSMRHPKDESLSFNVAAVSMRVAADQVSARRFDEAAGLFEQAGARFKSAGHSIESEAAVRSSAELHYLRGLSKLRKAPGDAARSIEKAISLDATHLEWRYALGAAYYGLGEFERACVQFDEFVSRGNAPSVAYQALAITLGRCGRPEEARKVWVFLSEQAAPETRVMGKVGLAALHAEGQRWENSAEILHELLEQHPPKSDSDRRTLSQLVVAYYSLAKQHAKAEAVVRNHFGVGSGPQDEYLGAILAQQGRVEEARARLDAALRTNQITEAGRDLYGHVSRIVAARAVKTGDFSGALRILNDLAEDSRLTTHDTLAMRDAVQAAVSLSGVGNGEVTRGTFDAYRTAYEKNQGNAHLLRNLAIVTDMFALTQEESGRPAEADTLWKQGCVLWKRVIESGGDFWSTFVAQYNEGRGRKDRIDERDITEIPSAIARRLSVFHAECARGFADQKKTSDLKRHIGYARSVGATAETLVPVSEVLVPLVERAVASKQFQEALDLAELAFGATPDSEKVRQAYIASLMGYAVDCATRNKAEEGVQLLERIRDTTPQLRDSLRDPLVTLYLALAINAVQRRDRNASAQYYRKASNLRPDLEQDESLRPLVLQYYLFSGLLFSDRQQIARAIELDPSLLDKVPQLRLVCLQMGIDLSSTNARRAASGA